MANRRMAYTHTNVITVQPTPVAVGNPKLLGSVHGLRDWSSGLCGCCDDWKGMMKVWFCLECVLCEMSTRTGECCCMPFCVNGGILALRTSIRRLGGIRGSIYMDSNALGCCFACAICQMLHELDEMGL